MDLCIVWGLFISFQYTQMWYQLDDLEQKDRMILDIGTHLAPFWHLLNEMEGQSLWSPSNFARTPLADGNTGRYVESLLKGTTQQA
jgi:hypothetical protein